MDLTGSSCTRPPLDLADVRERLSSHGLRPTRQREVVYMALHQRMDHPTAEDLHHAVQADEPGISLATIYNALEAFTDSGLASRVSTPGARGPAPCRFDADTTEHVHLLGADGSVRDVPHELGATLLSSLPADALRQIERLLGVRIDRVRIELVQRPGASDLTGPSP